MHSNKFFILFLMALTILFAFACDSSSDDSVADGDTENESTTDGDTDTPADGDKDPADGDTTDATDTADGDTTETDGDTTEPVDGDAEATEAVDGDTEATETVDGDTETTEVEADVTPGKAGLVVDLGTRGVHTECIDLPNGQMTGQELLEASSLTTVFSYDGLLCKIETVGCNKTDGKCDNCACPSYPDNCNWWNYYNLTSGAWVLSLVGAKDYDVVSGSVDGWIFNGGDPKPAVYTFDQICNPTTDGDVEATETEVEVETELEVPEVELEIETELELPELELELEKELEIPEIELELDKELDVEIAL